MGCPISRPYSSAYYSSRYNGYDDDYYDDYDEYNYAYEHYHPPRVRVRVGADGEWPRWRLVGGGGVGPWVRGRECCDRGCDGTVTVVGGFLG